MKLFQTCSSASFTRPEYAKKLQESSLLSPNKRQQFEKKMMELQGLYDAAGMEWCPSNNELEEIQQEMDSINAALQYDDRIREIEEEAENDIYEK